MNPGETIIDDALANELTAAKRVLRLARFRLGQDWNAHNRGRGFTLDDPKGVFGHDRDLLMRRDRALRRVRYLESLMPEW